MAVNKDTVEGTFDQVVGQGENFVGGAMGDTQTEVNGKVRELKGKAQEAYGKARETVKDWAEHAPESVREAREKAAKAAEEASSKVRHSVQEQPIATLAGGIALGFVVGWLLNRK